MTTPATMTDLTTGLTDTAVAQQVAAGQQNEALPPLTRSVRQIFRDNLFTLFNAINLVLGGCVLLTGSYKNLLFLGVVVVNTAIGIFQEIRSKRQVDKMAVLSESQIRLRRNGQVAAHHQETIVLADILEVGRGDQLPVDGVIRSTAGLEVDESQITGEATPIVKQVGDTVTSGSVILGGHAQVQATQVGQASFVNHLSVEAKQEKRQTSQLLTTINRIIKVLTVIIVPVGLILFISQLVRGADLNAAVLGSVAAMVGMIPEGLVLLTSVALAVGAFNLARRHVLVRELSAIEALARVDVICLDKTGTITSGHLKLQRLLPMTDQSAAQVARQLSELVTVIDDDNETATALKQGLPAVSPAPAQQVVPFSSARKWSGAQLADGTHLVMGAPEFIFSQLPAAVTSQIADLAAQGNRVLAFAQTTELPETGKPAAAQLLALILITDELRPHAKETFSYFANQEVALKVISGDNPATVAHIAAQAGIEHAADFVDMSTQDERANYDQLVADYTVFGRVTPPQKKSLIMAYQRANHTVAMTGDGVNDILALRQADCSIAMATGSEATKSIADFVLIDSNFDAMVDVLNEGRRVINNIERVASLFLIKTMYSVMLSVIFIFMHQSYPFQPIQLTPISTLTVGIPTFVLALQPNYARITDRFMRQVMEIAAPAALCVVGYIMIIMLLGFQFNLPFAWTSTLSVLLTGIIGLHALLLVARPLNRLKVGLVVVMAAAFLSVFLFFSHLFSLASLMDIGLALLYIPLGVSAIPVYMLVQDVLGRRLLSRVRWRS